MCKVSKMLSQEILRRKVRLEHLPRVGKILDSNPSTMDTHSKPEYYLTEATNITNAEE